MQTGFAVSLRPLRVHPARAAKGQQPLRLWEALPVNAPDPASATATKAAAVIERSRPNQFDGQFGTDLLDTLERVNKNQRTDHLRWTMGHVYDISPTNLVRAKPLGMTLGIHGAAMQAAAPMPFKHRR